MQEASLAAAGTLPGAASAPRPSRPAAAVARSARVRRTAPRSVRSAPGVAVGAPGLLSRVRDVLADLGALKPGLVPCAKGAIRVGAYKLIVGRTGEASWFGYFSPNISHPIKKGSKDIQARVPWVALLRQLLWRGHWEELPPGPCPCSSTIAMRPIGHRRAVPSAPPPTPGAWNACLPASSMSRRTWASISTSRSSTLTCAAPSLASVSRGFETLCRRRF